MKPLFTCVFLGAVLVLTSCTDENGEADLSVREPYSGVDHESIAEYFQGIRGGSHYFYFPDDGTVFILERTTGDHEWTDSKGLSSFLSESGADLKGWIVYTTVYDSFETPADFGILHNYLLKHRFSTQSLPNDPHPLATETRAQQDEALKP